ncbi:hypothetical protein ARHIZOSPH14_24260 [Agromyces rhizosphaerae]|uniref:Rhodanese domain-containing protein n=1 Tax=Agromyces rhizosphaerae TaxID=88374 RepID=A0A9W6FPM5_9MICO|nr:rhodanese-like domain-containing protein [Agromyces rhizosphaerae]GLI28184.1 hypothetical protein ARHIZOSPH14_24260 [Agromyces rhizosphaerae]
MRSITPTALATIDGATIIDVREVEEVEAASVRGATNIPMSVLAQRIGEVPREGTVYIMCASGGRSSRVTEYLEQQGYDVINVAGGITEWYRDGLPVELGSAK